jgi:hypothetical protein
VDPRADGDVVEKRNICCLCRIQNPNLSAVQPTARRSIDWAFPSPTPLINLEELIFIKLGSTSFAYRFRVSVILLFRILQ